MYKNLILLLLAANLYAESSAGPEIWVDRGVRNNTRLRYLAFLCSKKRQASMCSKLGFEILHSPKSFDGRLVVKSADAYKAFNRGCYWSVTRGNSNERDYKISNCIQIIKITQGLLSVMVGNRLTRVTYSDREADMVALDAYNMICSKGESYSVCKMCNISKGAIISSDGHTGKNGGLGYRIVPEGFLKCKTEEDQDVDMGSENAGLVTM
jgi:hypothetical protein